MTSLIPLQGISSHGIGLVILDSCRLTSKSYTMSSFGVRSICVDFVLRAISCYFVPVLQAKIMYIHINDIKHDAYKKLSNTISVFLDS